MKRLSILILFFSLLISCSEHNDIFINNKTISVIDSIQISGSNLDFDNYFNRKIVFHNPHSFSVYIYDFDSNTTKTFNHFGNNIDDHGYILKNINIINDTTIAIGKPKSINLYNINGKFIKRLTIKKDKQSHPPISNILFINDSLIAYRQTGMGNTADPDTYKLNEFIGRIYHLKKGIINRFGQFPEKESVYHDTKYFYCYPFMFTFRKDKDYIYTLSWNDPNVYQYKINTGNLTDIYKLKLNNYVAYKTNFTEGSQLDINKIIFGNYQNSEMYNFDINNKSIFIAYNKGFSKDNALDAIKNDAEKQNYLHIRSRSGKILFDNRLPKYLGKFMFEEQGYLYFLGENTEKSENENYSMIYKAKLIDKK